MRRFVRRHQPGYAPLFWIKSGIGAALGMGVVGWLGYMTDLPFLVAPFGATCVLLFAAHSSPLAQPVNVVGGHVVASAVSLALRMALPNTWWAIALAVGIVIAVLAATRLTHPPAGADPVVIFMADPGWDFLFVPALFGSVVLVFVAYIVHKIPPRATPYPLPVDLPPDNNG